MLVQFDPNVVPAWYLGVISGVARGAAVAIFNPISIVKTRIQCMRVTIWPVYGFPSFALFPLGLRRHVASFHTTAPK